MKFGKYLEENEIEIWTEHYIKYKSLKKFISMASMNPSTDDELFFCQRVQNNVRDVENWFITVRNACFERFDKVYNDLPSEIKSNILSFSKSTYVADNMEYSSIIKYDNSISAAYNSGNDTDIVLNMDKQTLNAPNVIADDDSPAEMKIQSTANLTSDENIKDSENDSEFGIDTNAEEKKMADDMKHATDDMVDDDLSDFMRKDEHGNIITHPPTQIFIDDGVFSHLPISDHRECLSILKTLAKLKLYAWQNGEGIRKIIKKYDKNFSKTLTTTLWPKIRTNEFMQAKKNDSYLAQVSAVLCTRIIPFGNFSVHELEEKGLNLKKMANSIKQLEAITDSNLKEIIPMNVEPRSYMANERTYLKWARMAAMSALVGMILMAMHYEPVTGLLLVLLSMAIVVRSYHEYYKRNEVLVNRIEYNWIDTLGPKLLLLSLLLPMSTYLVYLMVYGTSVNVFHK